MDAMFYTVGIFVLVIGACTAVFFVVFAIAWFRIAKLAVRERRDMAKDPKGRMAYAMTGRQARGAVQDGEAIAVRVNGVWRRTRGGTLLQRAPDAQA